MHRRLARRLLVAAVLSVSALATACPPPWYFWRHERREDRYERRGDRHDERRERHERNQDKRDERRERNERH